MLDFYFGNHQTEQKNLLKILLIHVCFLISIN